MYITELTEQIIGNFETHGIMIVTWNEALYSRVRNLGKRAVPQVGGHLRKMIWFSDRTIREQINPYIPISEAAKIS